MGDKVQYPFENIPREQLESMVSQLETIKDGLQDELQKLKGKISNGKSEPNTSETKVAHTQQEYHQRNQSHNTKTNNPPPTSPDSTPNTSSKPKATTTASNNKLPNATKNSLDLEKASRFLKNNRGKIALGALGVGVAKSIIDGEDDDLFTSTGKGVKAAVFVTGSSYATERLFKTQTVQDLVQGGNR